MDFQLPDGTRVHLIGDPHLGRKFEVGVPLHRKGEREAKQFQHFKDELEADADIIVMVGDLFDHPYVSYKVVDNVAKVCLDAARRRPDVLFIHIAGNHDLPQKVGDVGAFHDFHDRLAGREANLRIVLTPEIIRGIALFPWEWGRSAADQCSVALTGPVHAAVGHWDLSKFSEKQDHLAPVAELLAAFGDIPLYSGHYHRPADYVVAGTTIHGVGSMEPYSHGEDDAGALYVTLSLDQLEEIDPVTLRDKAVRILLPAGRDMPTLDCLALTSKLEKDIDEGDGGGGATITLSLDDFDWNEILESRIKPLDPAVQSFIRERITISVTEDQR